jgi:hypothetical protein
MTVKLIVKNAKKSKKKTTTKKTDGYKEHRPGSRKGKAHEMFDKLGRDALPKVVALGIKRRTAIGWFCSFAAKYRGRLIQCLISESNCPISPIACCRGSG